MQLNSYNYMSYSKNDMYQYMSNISPNIIKDIICCEGKSISDYAAKIWDFRVNTDSKIVKNGKTHLQTILFDEVKQQHNEEEAIKAIAEFDTNQVFQTGPHLQLIIERNNYFSGLFSTMGLNRLHHKFYFLSGCATSTLESRHLFGPNWFNIFDSNFNVFGLSKSYRRKTSEYCARGEFEFKFIPKIGQIQTKLVKEFATTLIDLLGGRTYETVVDAFHDANHKLFNTFLSDTYVPIFLDEDFYIKLLISHLKDTDSFVYRFFSDWDCQKIVMDTIKNDLKLPWNKMIPAQTDFFWLVTNQRVIPLAFEQDNIHSTLEKSNYKIKNDIPSILYCLENKEIVPNIFTIILMVSFVGFTRLAGGLHQFAYYKTFEKAFLNILDKENVEESKLYEEIKNNNLNHWGSHVFEPNIDVYELICDNVKSYDMYIDKFCNYSFDKSIDDLVQYRRYHRWGELICK